MRHRRKRPESARGRGAALLCFSVLASAAQAQSNDGAQRSTGLTWQPRVSVQMTATDNVTLSAQKDDALVTTISPGISVSSRGGRFVGSLDYSLSGILYTGTKQPDRFQQNLRASGTVQVIENVFVVDSVASINQQATSFLGAQSSDTTLGSNNRTEVASLTISPVLRSRIGSLASVDLRGNFGETRAKNNALGNVTQTGGTLSLTGLNPGMVNWFGTLSDQRQTYRGFGDNYNSAQAYAGLQFQPDVDVGGSLSLGRERSNYLGQEQTTGLYGASVIWTPSPRTRASLDWMHHSYGDSHTINVEHRLARSAFRYTDTQGVSQQPQVGQSTMGSIYDLLFQEYASIEPDPVKRDQLVRAYLLSNGVNPDAQLVGQVLTNAPTIQRTQQLSYTFTGVRMSFVLSGQMSRTDRLGTTTIVAGDLTAFQRVIQRGVTATVTHKLTPISSAGVSLSLLRNSGQFGTSLLGNEVQLRTLTVSWDTRLAQRTQLSVMARHAQSTGAATYSENAITANLVQLF